ncbi:MAG: 5-(carboxyamino)imidazole ribonucleotide mutase [Candidatus Aminicenantales bacterium]|jgi:phosphoribosylaminoimidazole carboxylase PurE protein
MDVVIFIGSASDLEIVKDAVDILKRFGVEWALEVTSAHRSPRRTVDLVRRYETAGAEVFIAVAGKAAHLAGVVAAHTVRPVIGVPVESGGLGGLDALLSTVQMPKGIPVAAMGTGKTGGSNAALLALQILAVKNPDLRGKLVEEKARMAAQVEADSEKVRREL